MPEGLRDEGGVRCHVCDRHSIPGWVVFTSVELTAIICLGLGSWWMATSAQQNGGRPSDMPIVLTVAGGLIVLCGLIGFCLFGCCVLSIHLQETRRTITSVV